MARFPVPGYRLIAVLGRGPRLCCAVVCCCWLICGHPISNARARTPLSALCSQNVTLLNSKLDLSQPGLTLQAEAEEKQRAAAKNKAPAGAKDATGKKRPGLGLKASKESKREAKRARPAAPEAGTHADALPNAPPKELSASVASGKETSAAAQHGAEAAGPSSGGGMGLSSAVKGEGVGKLGDGGAGGVGPPLPHFDDKNTVFVKFLPSTVTEEELRALFHILQVRCSLCYGFLSQCACTAAGIQFGSCLDSPRVSHKVKISISLLG